MNWSQGEDTCCPADPIRLTPNPVHQHEDGTWWFYNEIWADECGPFETKALSEAACVKYAEMELGQ